MVQWLRLQASNEGVMGSGPGWGSKISHAMKYGQKKFFLIKKKIDKNIQCPIFLILKKKYSEIQICIKTDVYSWYSDVLVSLKHG